MTSLFPWLSLATLLIGAFLMIRRRRDWKSDDDLRVDDGHKRTNNETIH